MILGRGHTHFALPELSLKGPAVIIIPTIASSPHYSTKEQQTLQYVKEHEAESSLLVSASELTFGGLLSRLVYTYTVCVPHPQHCFCLTQPLPPSSFSFANCARQEVKDNQIMNFLFPLCLDPFVKRKVIQRNPLSPSYQLE